MKKSKIIGVGVATFGILLSFCTSIALYSKEASNITFEFGGIGYTPHSGNINFKLGEEEISGGAINPSNKVQTIKVPLSAVYPAGVIAQDSKAGNIAIEFTADDALANKVSVTARVSGYQEGSYYANNEEVRTLLNNVSYTGTAIEVNKDIFVKAGDENPTIANNQYLEVLVTYDVTDENMLALAEKQVHLDVTWDAPSSDFVPAYVKGDGNGWDAVDEYEMVALLNGSDWDWTFKNLTGFNRMKIFKPVEAGDDIWVGAGNDGSADVELDPELTYQVYWKESQINVSAHESDGVNYVSHVD